MTKEENIQRLERLKQIVLSLPEKPGSYQYYDRDGVIIYVGKAKNLKARVSSYFHKEVDRFKTKVLVSKIWNISYTVVNTEEDALLLENALIKKYNVSPAQITRLKRNESVSTNTINMFCEILNCSVEEIMEYVPDNK